MKANKTKEKIQFPEEELKTRKKYRTNILLCLLNAILIEIYFIALNSINKFIKTQFDVYIKILYMIFVFVAVILFEKAYKKENKNLAITGIEFVFLSIHTLLIGRSITLFNETDQFFILSTSYIWPAYYCFKAVLIHTKENKRRLKQISDIHEIVKEEKPIKKVAKKRKT